MAMLMPACAAPAEKNALATSTTNDVRIFLMVVIVALGVGYGVSWRGC